MLKLTHGEKQIILYSKNHFQRTDLMQDLTKITSKEYGLPLEYTLPYSVYGFVLDIFFKLQKMGYIKIEIQDFLEKLFDSKNHKIGHVEMIQKMMSEIQNVFVNGLNLGAPDHTLLPSPELEKKCPNCGELHYGMFEDCYQCFDCETEAEYGLRREESQ